MRRAKVNFLIKLYPKKNSIAELLLVSNSNTLGYFSQDKNTININMGLISRQCIIRGYIRKDFDESKFIKLLNGILNHEYAHYFIYHLAPEFGGADCHDCVNLFQKWSV